MSSYMQLTIHCMQELLHPTSNVSHTTQESKASFSPKDTQAPLSLSSLPISTQQSSASFSQDSDITDTLSNPSLVFTITKAHITESLVSPFSIECEGYIESMQSDVLRALYTSLSAYATSPHSSAILHPSILLDSEASFSFTNPYHQENNILAFHTASKNNSSLQTYRGIITQVSYLGNTPQHDLASQDYQTSKFGYKHFFSFTLSSALMRLSYNNAQRIYTHTTILEIIKSLLYSHVSLLHKALDFSLIHSHYEMQEIITQYNESDLAFLLRLAHNNGIFLYEDSNAFYICDTLRLTQPQQIMYNPNPNNTLHEECVSNFSAYRILQPNNFSGAYTANANPLDIAFTLPSTHTEKTMFNTDTSINPTLHRQATMNNSTYIPNNAISSNTNIANNTNTFNNTMNTHTINNATFSNTPSNNTNFNNSSPHTSSPDTYPNTTHAINAKKTPYLREHSYDYNLSFSHTSPIKTTLSLKEQHALMLDSLFSATSNITHLSLGQAISLHHALSATSDIPHNTFGIIGLEHTLISKEKGNTPINTSHNTNTQVSTSYNSLNTQHNTSTHIYTTITNPQNKTIQGNHNTSDFAYSNIPSIHSTTSHVALDSHHSYNNTLTLIPSHIAFVPPIKPKPMPPSSTQGIVIGEGYIQATNLQEANDSILKEANTLYTDNFGRVRVRLNSFYAYALSQAQNLQTQHNIESNNIDPTLMQQNNKNINTTQNHTNNNTKQQTTGNTNPNNTMSNYRDNAGNINNEIHNNTNNANNNINNTSNNTTNSHNNTLQNNNTIQSNQTISLFKSLLHSHTPFLRVATSIASNHSGLFHIPRVADEVIISFLDNDIDKPYISASLYNPSNPSLATLPFNTYQTSLSARTINQEYGEIEQGMNELTLNNQKEKEEIYIHAQRDYTEQINNDFHQTIKHNKDSKVLGSYTESIHHAHIQNIAGLKNVNIGAEYLTNVALSKDTIVGLSHTLNVGADNKVRIANTSSEYIGGDKEIEIKQNYIQSIQGDKNITIEGNKKEIIEGHLGIHSNENLHLSANDELALSSQKNLHLLSKESLALRSDENLTFNIKDLYAKAKQEINYHANTSINLSVSETTTITLEQDKIILKVKESELILDDKGLSINKPVSIKK